MGPAVFTVAGHGVAVLSALGQQVEGEKWARGNFMADVIVPSPETTGLDELLARFGRAHHHEDDDARFILAGDGVFGFGPEGGDPLTVKVSAGDYFIVPAGMYHWFTLIRARHIKAIRLFKDTTSWAPHYR